jgi:SAM-dependent methyltransferase
MSPLSNAFLDEGSRFDMEPFYPLHAWLCTECLLVQLGSFETPERIFGEYAYFSSYSVGWVEHARRYSEEAIAALALDGRSRVLEIGSNDGYLLTNFVARGIPALGVEPAANVARVAEQRGVRTRVAFFGARVAEELVAGGWRADLVIANNVLAHVPALNDFVTGLGIVLKEDGVATLEFPHLLRLIEQNQFDTIYHEHFSYFSLATVQRIFAAHGLAVVDVEELPTHGGSLRVHARPAAARVAPSPRVRAVLEAEEAAGLHTPAGYDGFQLQVLRARRALLDFFIAARRAGKRVAGYGAAAKGNTLLNYCGIRGDLLEFVADRSPHKQGRWLPGSHIPVVAPGRIFESRPDYLLILPWNHAEEITAQMEGAREWGCRFVVPIPCVRELP